MDPPGFAATLVDIELTQPVVDFEACPNNVTLALKKTLCVIKDVAANGIVYWGEHRETRRKITLLIEWKTMMPQDYQPLIPLDDLKPFLVSDPAFYDSYLPTPIPDLSNTVYVIGLVQLLSIAGTRHPSLAYKIGSSPHELLVCKVGQRPTFPSANYTIMSPTLYGHATKRSPTSHHMYGRQQQYCWRDTDYQVHLLKDCDPHSFHDAHAGWRQAWERQSAPRKRSSLHVKLFGLEDEAFTSNCVTFEVKFRQWESNTVELDHHLSAITAMDGSGAILTSGSDLDLTDFVVIDEHGDEEGIYVVASQDPELTVATSIGKPSLTDR